MRVVTNGLIIFLSTNHKQTMQGIKATQTIEVDFISYFKAAVERSEFKYCPLEELRYAQYIYNVFKATRDESYTYKHAVLQDWLHQWTIKEQHMNEKQVDTLSWELVGHVIMKSPSGVELKFELSDDSVTAWHFKPSGEERFKPITNENAKGVLLNYVFPSQPEATYSFQLFIPFIHSESRSIQWFVKCFETDMLDFKGEYNQSDKRHLLYSPQKSCSWNERKQSVVHVSGNCKNFIKANGVTDAINAFVNKFKRIVEDEYTLLWLSRGSNVYNIEFKLVQKPCQSSESSQTSISE